MRVYNVYMDITPQDIINLTTNYLKGLDYVCLPVRGKVPLVKGWTVLLPDEWSQLEEWKKKAVTGYGISPLDDSGFVILDIDDRRAADKIEKKITSMGGCLLGVRTKKGAHFYMTDPSDLRPRGKISNGKGEWVSQGGSPIYCVGPGSAHPEGGTYDIIEEISLGKEGQCTVDDFDWLVNSRREKDTNKTNNTYTNREETLDVEGMNKIRAYFTVLGLKPFARETTDREWKSQCPMGNGLIKVPKKLRSGLCTKKPEGKVDHTNRFWINAKSESGYLSCRMCDPELYRWLRKRVLDELDIPHPKRLRDDAAAVLFPQGNNNNITPCGPEDNDFWEAMPFLTHIRDSCLASEADPIPALLNYFSRLSAISWPIWTSANPNLPTPLNFYTLITGAVGEGKSKSARVTDKRCIEWPKNPKPEIPVRDFLPEKKKYRALKVMDPVSKQGFFDSLLVRGVGITRVGGKEIKERMRMHYFPGGMSFLTSDERFGKTVEKWEKNSDDTTGFIRTAFMGDELIITSSEKYENRPEVHTGGYSLGLSVRGVPSEMVQLLTLENGLSERFMYAEASEEEWEHLFPDLGDVHVVKRIKVPNVKKIAAQLDTYTVESDESGASEVVHILPFTKSAMAAWDHRRNDYKLENRRIDKHMRNTEDLEDHSTMELLIRNKKHLALIQMKLAALIALHDKPAKGKKWCVRKRHWDIASRLIERRNTAIHNMLKQVSLQNRKRALGEGRRNAVVRSSEQKAMEREKIRNMDTDERIQMLLSSAIEKGRIKLTKLARTVGKKVWENKSEMRSSVQYNVLNPLWDKCYLTKDDIDMKDVVNSMWLDYEENQDLWTIHS